MSKFKVGDMVKRVKNQDIFNNLNLPLVIRVSKIGKHGSIFVNGSDSAWDASYFEKATPLEIMTVESLVHFYPSATNLGGPTPPDVGIIGPSNCPKGVSGKYNRLIIGLDGVRTEVDVYRVLDAFQVTDPCLQHLIKKALCSGLRGHKDRLQDLEDIKLSIEKAIVLHKQKESK